MAQQDMIAAIVREVRPYADAFAHWRRDAESASLPVEVDIDGLRLHGRIGDAWPQGIARLRFGKPNGPSSIRNGLDWLLARAAGVGMPFVEFHETEGHGIGPHPREAIAPEQAIEALRGLLALRREGLRRPLPFAPYSAWEFFAARVPILARWIPSLRVILRVSNSPFDGFSDVTRSASGIATSRP
mgnify:CR=1 FL=1